MPTGNEDPLEMLDMARRVRPWTPGNLRDYIACYYKRRIPDYPNGTPCAGHDSPFAYLVGSNLTERDMEKWTAKDRARFRPHGSCVVHACRSGGKTEEGGISAHLKGIHIPNCGITILGGSQKQSERMHNVTRPANQFVFGDMIAGDPTASRTRFRNGSDIEILVQSATSVRSPHVPILMLDEVDEFDEVIYGDALGIPQSMNGIQSRVEEFSTAHRPGGLMERVIKGAEMAGERVYRWCIFEVLKKCPYPCSPKKPFKKCDELVKYDALNTPHRFYDVCDGRAKRGDGYYEITDLWQKFQNPIWTWERFACEMLCEMPQLEDAAFPMLADLHLVPDWPCVPAPKGWLGSQFKLVLGADAGPMHTWVVWALVGRIDLEHDDFDTFQVLHQFSTDKAIAVSDRADMIVSEHARFGFPKATGLFTGPASVPQDSELAMELDKEHRRSRLFLPTPQAPSGRRCMRVNSEGKQYGWEMMANLLSLRTVGVGRPRPALVFGASARATYDSLAAQQNNQDEAHGVAATRYLVRGWEQFKGIITGSYRPIGRLVVASSCSPQTGWLGGF